MDIPWSNDSDNIEQHAPAREEEEENEWEDEVSLDIIWEEGYWDEYEEDEGDENGEDEKEKDEEEKEEEAQYVEGKKAEGQKQDEEASEEIKKEVEKEEEVSEEGEKKGEEVKEASEEIEKKREEEVLEEGEKKGKDDEEASEGKEKKREAEMSEGGEKKGKGDKESSEDGEKKREEKEASNDGVKKDEEEEEVAEVGEKKGEKKEMSEEGEIKAEEDNEATDEGEERGEEESSEEIAEDFVGEAIYTDQLISETVGRMKRHRQILLNAVLTILLITAILDIPMGFWMLGTFRNIKSQCESEVMLDETLNSTTTEIPVMDMVNQNNTDGPCSNYDELASRDLSPYVELFSAFLVASGVVKGIMATSMYRHVQTDVNQYLLRMYVVTTGVIVATTWISFGIGYNHAPNPDVMSKDEPEMMKLWHSLSTMLYFGVGEAVIVGILLDLMCVMACNNVMLERVVDDLASEDRDLIGLENV